MKKTISLLILFLLPIALWAQDIEGSWVGEAQAGDTELRLVFNFTRDGEGYAGTMDSPDQGVKGFPLTSVEFDGRTVTVSIAQLGFTYTGNLSDDGTIDGEMVQGVFRAPILFTRGNITVNRPQEPRPPYPYRSEEVRFDNPADVVTLAGTLTLPEGGGKFPAVLMVTGSGPQNRDEELFDHKPFLVIADHLTRRGIAVLRYDDRGFAESTGSFAGSTSEDFMRDALSAFDYLRTRDEIEPAHIGVIGHSEGGTIAFMMAARQPELGFVVSMAGGLIRGDSVLVLQNRDMLLQQGLPAELVDGYCTALRDAYIIKNTRTPEYIDGNIDTITENLTGYGELPPPMQQSLVSVLQMSDPWFDYFIKKDPTGDIEKTRCPVLAINGGRDVQVDAVANLGNAARALDRGGNTRYITRIYPEMNHLFQQCTTGAVTEYNQIEQTIAPEVLDEMAGWILEITASK